MPQGAHTSDYNPYLGLRDVMASGVAADMSESALLHDPAVAGAAGVLGTAFLGWLGTRMVGKAALETAMRDTFKEVMEQLRTELRVAIAERDAARRDAYTSQAKVEELTRTISALEVRVAAAVMPRA